MTFEPPAHAAGSCIYDVIFKGEVIGIAWGRAGRWHAAQYSMTDTGIDKATRDEAAEQPVRRPQLL